MPQAEVPQALPEASARGSRARKVLLAEDCPQSALLFHSGFAKPPPWKVGWMPDEEDVLSFLLKRPPYEDAWTPILIGLNINLPHADGLTLLREIKSAPALAPIPIVTWSVSQNREEIAFSYQHGAAAFVSKPVWEIRRQIAAIRAFWEEAQPPLES